MHPQYRIAMITISAADDMIERDITKRLAETGRDIPLELRRATSVDETSSGIMRLTYLVDLVASVQKVPDRISGPVLKFVSLVDSSGNWELVRQLTSIK